jgi:hypothetical protein
MQGSAREEGEEKNLTKVMFYIKIWGIKQNSLVRWQLFKSLALPSLQVGTSSRAFLCKPKSLR